MIKNLVALLALFISSFAFAGSPDWTRTFSYPFTGAEFSLTPPAGGCNRSSGCFPVENRSGYWLSPGADGAAEPGNALVIDEAGVVHGMYVGDFRIVGPYTDVEFGVLPMIDGAFYPAIRPGTATDRQTVYVTADPGVTHYTGKIIQFRPEVGVKPEKAYDLRMKRVVELQIGRSAVIGHCQIYVNVQDRSGIMPAAWTSGDCKMDE